MLNRYRCQCLFVLTLEQYGTPGYEASLHVRQCMGRLTATRSRFTVLVTTEASIHLRYFLMTRKCG